MHGLCQVSASLVELLGETLTIECVAGQDTVVTTQLLLTEADQEIPTAELSARDSSYGSAVSPGAKNALIGKAGQVRRLSPDGRPSHV